MFRFKTSYEEWKQIQAVVLTGWVGGFKTSYEEWKPASFSLITVIGSCFKTSYEEWKRGYCGVGITGDTNASKLPMRNGNLASTQNSISHNELQNFL